MVKMMKGERIGVLPDQRPDGRDSDLTKPGHPLPDVDEKPGVFLRHLPAPWFHHEEQVASCGRRSTDLELESWLSAWWLCWAWVFLI